MSILLLKAIALICMTFDHVGVYLGEKYFFLRIIGRISAPIFLFSSVEAMKHSSNRYRYIKRLYFFSIFCAIVQCFLQIDNNFIRCLFETAIIIIVLEKYTEDKRYFFFLLAWQILAYILVFWICYSYGENYITMALIPSILGSIFLCEGGIVFIVLGVFLYFSKSKKTLAILYGVFCFIVLFLTGTKYMLSLIFYLNRLSFWGINLYIGDFLELLLNTTATIIAPMNVGGSIIYENNQWFMILALPLFLVYNGHRTCISYSPKAHIFLKYAFYIYYPLHLLILYLIWS